MLDPQRRELDILLMRGLCSYCLALQSSPICIGALPIAVGESHVQTYATCGYCKITDVDHCSPYLSNVGPRFEDASEIAKRPRSQMLRASAPVRRQATRRER